MRVRNNGPLTPTQSPMSSSESNSYASPSVLRRNIA